MKIICFYLFIQILFEWKFWHIHMELDKTRNGPAVKIWTPNGQKAKDMVGCKRGDTENRGGRDGQ